MTACSRSRNEASTKCGSQVGGVGFIGITSTVDPSIRPVILCSKRCKILVRMRRKWILKINDANEVRSDPGAESPAT